MVQINGKTKIVVYEMDDQKSVINRIAAYFNTMPKYIYFPQGVPNIRDFREDEKNIVVEDLFSKIKEGESFRDLYDEMKLKLSQQNLVIIKDVLRPYIIYKLLRKESSDKYIDSYILAEQEALSQFMSDIDNNIISKIWENREQFKKKISEMISKNIEDNNKKIRIFEIFHTIDPSKQINYSPFELESIDLEFTLLIDNKVSIMEIFNNIKVNTTIPFVCINNIFKISKEFIPSIDWSQSLESAILLKVLQKRDLVGTNFSDYTDVILHKESDDNNNEIIKIGLSYQNSKIYLQREEIISRITGSIKDLGEIKIAEDIQEDNVRGVFYFQNHSINKYVLGDLIMNNPLFSLMMSVNESEKASKKKEGIYIYFSHPLIGDVSANITEKISKKGDPSLRGKDVKNDFQLGTRYIRVRISRADNIETVLKFQKMLAKLLLIYDKEYKNVVNIYRKYIPKFGDTKKNVIKKVTNLTLKDLEPDIFTKGYPKTCPNPPEIIDDEESKKAKKEGKIVMRYPKSDKENLIQRNYICNYSKKKYPGLRTNPLIDNEHKFPFLPCCYDVNHDDKIGSIYRHYYHGERIIENSDLGQQELIKTKKFVNKDKFGTLPEDITKIFDSLDHQDGYSYIRKGMFDTKSSFLDCVLEGLYEETNVLRLTKKKDREKELIRIRQLYSEEKHAASCRQEMYDFTIEDIRTAIRDPEVYMDPKLFTSFLEKIFNCNIFVFNRNNIDKGELSIPRHLQSYYKQKRESKCIFIYEHMGSYSDYSKYPRCELIVKWKLNSSTSDGVSYYFNSNSKVAKGINKIFTKMCKTYSLNIEIEQTIFPEFNKEIKLLSQCIDSYGKCRMINFRYIDILGTILTTPMSPLVVPETKNWNVHKIDIVNHSSFENLKNIMQIVLSGRIVNKNKTKEIYGLIGNVKVSIPIRDKTHKNNVYGLNILPKIDKNISYHENTVSVIDKYNIYKKLSRYITQYFLWLFSRYIKNNYDNIGDKEITEFVDNNIIINENFEYKGYIAKSFELNSVLMTNGKLVLKSMETLKRLVYVLKVSMRDSINKIRLYHNRSYIENYYVDPTDFKQDKSHVIIHGENSVEKWILENKIKYSLYNSVQVSNSIIPYFFKNPLIDDKIYLVQNTDNIEKALKIATDWENKGYNNQKEIESLNITEENSDKFTLYSYVSSTNITKHEVNGKNPSNIKLIGYKINNVTFYSVLLSL